jgi:hypothetical protein
MGHFLSPWWCLPGLVVLALPGILPAWLVTRRFLESLVLAPLLGAFLAGLGAIATLGLAGYPMVWFLVLSLLVNLVVFVVVRLSKPTKKEGPLSGGFLSWRGASALLVLAGAFVPLVVLTRPAIGFDARSIWLLHAIFYGRGHHAVVHALTNPGLAVTEATFPPMSAGAVSVDWFASGLVPAMDAYRVGVACLACLFACSISFLGFRLQRLVAEKTGFRSSVGLVVPALTGGLVAFACYGIAGRFATNGYVDALWAALATGGVFLGLIEPVGPGNLWCAVVLLWCASIVKQEAMVIASLLALLCFLRASRVLRWIRTDWGLGKQTIAEVGLLALASWPGVLWWLTALAIGVDAGTDLSGPRHGTLPHRLVLASDYMAPHLVIAFLAIAIGLLVVASRWQRRENSLLWSTAAVVIGAVAILAAYGLAHVPLRPMLETSVRRTTIFSDMAGLVVLVCTGLLAMERILPLGRGTSERLVAEPSGQDKPLEATPSP